ncbi:cobalamin B12-binding domain-containing protein [Natranaerofaba carboxydovora]|uniref:cobalamin B12-binding domain-containing protein n=1 Tax=Natranaerofaba carboxydovora TaxID=2742683 RepID=UPI001F13C13D|nr:corrinoid protein [Natranaerofaba carboxydovora]UMZ73618.1 Methionine synthase [Natranaerofaba carboxydovora]
MEATEKIREAVMAGEEEDVVENIKEALNSDVPIQQITQEGLTKAMDEIGPKMASGELFVPEVLMCAEAMKKGLEYLKPMMQEGDHHYLGKVVVGTVEGDLHDIGKNMVVMMLESSGFEVVDLGIDVPVNDFVEAAKEHKPEIMGLSALLTTTMPAMKETVNALKDNNIDAKIIVGGAPVSEEFAEEIGADGYGSDASSAVELSKDIMQVS